MLKRLNGIITFNLFFILKKYKYNADDDLIVYLTGHFNRDIPTGTEASEKVIAELFVIHLLHLLYPAYLRASSAAYFL